MGLIAPGDVTVATNWALMMVGERGSDSILGRCLGPLQIGSIVFCAPAAGTVSGKIR